ncbi:hypothetical protein ACFVZH_21970 [Streptomyces sp. NPDC059534]|uniref:hypothetical protein n=1 Tax=Streptomyces sp. NPDC059534 TaxID=3346859 RepID=UPI00369A0BF6
MNSTSLRNTRAGRGLALAALCTLALTACGTEGTGSRTPAGAGAGATRVADPTPPAAPTPTPTAPLPDPADDPRLTPAQQAAELRLMELALDVAGPCAGGPPPVPTAEPDAPSARPGAPLPPPVSGPSDIPVPVEDPEPPTETPWSFERARQEVELSDVDKCVAPRHGDRIAKALDGGTPANPADVDKALRGLGYDVDYRLHGPRKTNGTVEFTLDLRFMGGELCLTGRFDGTDTAFDPYGASPEVRCTDVKRRA